MSAFQVFLEILLLGLLAVTIMHSVRLDRALGVLRRDRAALEQLVQGFNDSTRLAEDGVERLRSTAEGAGKQIAKQIEKASALRDDLNFLEERGGRLADRLEDLVQKGKLSSEEIATAVEARPAVARVRLRSELHATEGTGAEPGVRSRAERDLLRALRVGR